MSYFRLYLRSQRAALLDEPLDLLNGLFAFNSEVAVLYNIMEFFSDSGDSNAAGDSAVNSHIVTDKGSSPQVRKRAKKTKS